MVGKELGLDGEDLCKFIKEQQALECEELHAPTPAVP